jgi:UDP-N-acetylmuramoyl-L-alanyl-D-glutamate--2,6-diaminopimelate ligase
MGRIGSELADLCVITSDNPRTEDPDTIIAQILDGITPQNRTKCAVEPDRMKAIHLAIDKAQKNDLVLLAGKGHETYQILGTRRIHFNDREIAQEALKEKGADHSLK